VKVYKISDLIESCWFWKMQVGKGCERGDWFETSNRKYYDETWM